MPCTETFPSHIDFVHPQFSYVNLDLHSYCEDFSMKTEIDNDLKLLKELHIKAVRDSYCCTNSGQTVSPSWGILTKYVNNSSTLLSRCYLQHTEMLCVHQHLLYMQLIQLMYFLFYYETELFLDTIK